MEIREVCNVGDSRLCECCTCVDKVAGATDPELNASGTAPIVRFCHCVGIVNDLGMSTTIFSIDDTSCALLQAGSCDER